MKQRTSKFYISLHIQNNPIQLEFKYIVFNKLWISCGLLKILGHDCLILNENGMPNKRSEAKSWYSRMIALFRVQNRDPMNGFILIKENQIFFWHPVVFDILLFNFSLQCDQSATSL